MERFAESLGRLEHTCAGLAGGDGKENHGRGGVRLRSSLTEQQRKMLALNPSLPDERSVAEVAREAAGRADLEAEASEWHRLRARRAGLQMRLDKLAEAEAEGKRPEDASTEALRQRLAELEKRDSERGPGTESSATLEQLQRKARDAAARTAELQAHVQDLVAVSRIPSVSAPSSSLSDAVSKSNQRKRARETCDEFAQKATAFEQDKRRACQASSELQGLKTRVGQLEAQLEELQSQAKSKRNMVKLLSESTRRVVASSAHPMAKALHLLVSAGGEMLLDDWKAHIAKALELSNARTIQHVYALVANSLVNIDRTQTDARVLSLVV